MKKVFLGALVALLGTCVVGFLYLRLGYLDSRADVNPTRLESKWAMEFLDASTERHAEGLQNPLEASEANLIAGMKLYERDCAFCHGDADHPKSTLGMSFYPRAPQFLADPPDMEENESFYLIKHGVRWTAMPAWAGTLTDDEIWKVTTFLSEMNKLPPAVEKEWRKSLP